MTGVRRVRVWGAKSQGMEGKLRERRKRGKDKDHGLQRSRGGGSPCREGKEEKGSCIILFFYVFYIVY